MPPCALCRFPALSPSTFNPLPPPAPGPPRAPPPPKSMLPLRRMRKWDELARVRQVERASLCLIASWSLHKLPSNARFN
eukprot:6177268-Pleurochrysis_carterae.AAC.2